MAIYMNYNNKSPTGDVTESGHKDWIELSSLQWGVGRGISSPCLLYPSDAADE